MPYSSVNDPKLPEHVQQMSEEKRRQWIAVFNSVYDKTGDDGQAMTTANGSVKRASTKACPEPIKALSEDVFGGYGVVFTSPDRPDLTGDYFDASTFFWPDMPTSVVLYDHAMGYHPDGLKQTKEGVQIEAMPAYRYRIGHVVKRAPDEHGLYFEFELDPEVSIYDDKLKLWQELVDEEHQQWLDHIREMLLAGKLNFSSDSIEHLVEREYVQEHDVYHIKSWPIPLISITPKAAEPEAMINQVSTPLATYSIDSEALANRPAQNEKQLNVKQDNSMEAQNMSISTPDLQKIAALTVKEKWDSLKDFDFKALIQTFKSDDGPVEGEAKQIEGDFAAQIQPIAQSLATLYGGTPEEWMAAVMQIGASMQLEATNPTTEAEPQMAAEEAPPDGQGAMMSFNRKNVTAAINAGSYKTVNVLRRDPDKAPQFPRFIKALAYPTRGDSIKFLNDYHKKSYAAWKTMGVNPDSAGGYLVAPEISTEVIENLRSESVVFNMVKRRPMPKGILEVPRIATGSTVTATAENATITNSELALDLLSAVPIKLAVNIPVSAELVEDSDPDVQSMIMEDVVAAFGETFDTQILRGSGVGSNLLGLINRPGITQTAAGGGTLSYDDLAQAQARFEEGLKRLNPTAEWLLDPTSKRIVREIEDGTGRLIFTGGTNEGNQMSGRLPAYLLDYTWRLSTNVVASGAATRNIYLAKWDEIILGMRKEIEFKTSDQAGTAWVNDQIWIRAIARVALIVRHDEAVQIITGITGPQVI